MELSHEQNEGTTACVTCSQFHRALSVRHRSNGISKPWKRARGLSGQRAHEVTVPMFGHC